MLVWRPTRASRRRQSDHRPGQETARCWPQRRLCRPFHGFTASSCAGSRCPDVCVPHVVAFVPDFTAPECSSERWVLGLPRAGARRPRDRVSARHLGCPADGPDPQTDPSPVSLAGWDHPRFARVADGVLDPPGSCCFASKLCSSLGFAVDRPERALVGSPGWSCARLFDLCCAVHHFHFLGGAGALGRCTPCSHEAGILAGRHEQVGEPGDGVQHVLTHVVPSALPSPQTHLTPCKVLQSLKLRLGVQRPPCVWRGVLLYRQAVSSRVHTNAPGREGLFLVPGRAGALPAPVSVLPLAVSR